MPISYFARSLLCFFLAGAALRVVADPIAVRHPVGSARGFAEVRDLSGKRIASGDLRQRIHGSQVSSQLTLRFFDGSLDDETTVFSQQKFFRLISNHHVQRGPSFPKPIDITLDVAGGLVISRSPTGEIKQDHLDLPADVSNGFLSLVLMNLPPSVSEGKIAYVAGSRLIHLAIKSAGEVPFTVGGTQRRATDFILHPELGVPAGVIAPLIGRAPADYHAWILRGPDPAFIREEGPLYEGGPVWRIEQIGPEFADHHD